MVVKWVRKNYKDDIYESIALEALSKAVIDTGGYRDVRAYVMRCVYNACKANVKKKRPEETYKELSREDHFDELVSILPDDLRKLVTLKIKGKYKNVDLAKRYRKTEGWVRYKLEIAYNILRQRIG